MQHWAYFTAGRLINTIWIEGLTEEEMLILADETPSDVSRYIVHSRVLSRGSQ